MGMQFVQELWGHEDRVFSLTVIIVIFITGYNSMIYYKQITTIENKLFLMNVVVF